MVEPVSSLILYSLILIASYIVFNIWVRWSLRSLSKRRMRISYPKWGKAIAGINIVPCLLSGVSSAQRLSIAHRQPAQR